jgi:hypothetical protein
MGNTTRAIRKNTVNSGVAGAGEGVRDKANRRAVNGQAEAEESSATDWLGGRGLGMVP